MGGGSHDPQLATAIQTIRSQLAVMAHHLPGLASHPGFAGSYHGESQALSELVRDSLVHLSKELHGTENKDPPPVTTTEQLFLSPELAVDGPAQEAAALCSSLTGLLGAAFASTGRLARQPPSNPRALDYSANLATQSSATMCRALATWTTHDSQSIISIPIRIQADSKFRGIFLSAQWLSDRGFSLHGLGPQAYIQRADR